MREYEKHCCKRKTFFYYHYLDSFFSFFFILKTYVTPRMIHFFYTQKCSLFATLFFLLWPSPLSLSTAKKKDVCGIKIYFYGELLMKRFVLLLNVWFTSARIYCWLKLSLSLEINWKSVHSKIPKIPFKLK